MDAEIVNAIINVGGVIVGAIIGAGISLRITKQQLSLSIKQQKLQLLKSEFELLQKISSEFSSLKADVSSENLSNNQIASKLVDLFVSKSTVFLSYSYEFSEILEKEVEEAVSSINTIIFKSKTGQELNSSEVKNVTESIPQIEKRMTKAIKERLREIKKSLDKENQSI